MRLFSYLFVCLFFVCNAPKIGAQDTDALLKKANKLYEAQAYLQAIDIYTDILTYDNTLEAKEKLAHSYRKVSEFEKAEYWYRLIIPIIKDRKLDFNLAQVLQAQEKYQEAAQLYRSYADIYPRAEVFAQACLNKDQFFINTTKYKIDELSFNSSSSEFGPVLFKNNQLVFASSQNGKKNSKNDFSQGNESYLDLFSSQPFVSEWAKPKPLKGSINSQFHDGPACFDKYFQTVWFTRNTSAKGKGVKDQTKKLHLQLLEATVGENDKWSNIKPFAHNSENYSVAHPTLSPNGQLLYFSSNMPGGYGNSDLYVCVKIDTTWSQPKNLGPDINTPEDEQFPYIHDDGTLYFSSNGHPGLGGFDIFFSKPVKRHWSQPQNMGAPINSAKDDFSIVFDNRGGGFFASNRDGGKGDDDIYKFTINGQLNYPKSIEGSQEVEEAQYANYSDQNIIDGSYQQDASANNTLTYPTTQPQKPKKEGNNSSNKKEKKPKNEAKTEKTPKPAKNKADKNDVSKPPKQKEPKSAEKSSKKDKEQKPTEKNKQKDKNQNNAPAQLPTNSNIIAEQVPKESLNFELNIGPVQFKGKNGLMTEEVLDQIAPVILYARENPRTVIRIESFTDARGTARANVELSKQRLSSIVAFFYQNGITQDYLELVARGETGILNNCFEDDDCSVADHQFNQRVIFTKIDKNTEKIVQQPSKNIGNEEFIDFEANQKANEKDTKRAIEQAKKEAKEALKPTKKQKDKKVKEPKQPKAPKAPKAPKMPETAPTMPTLTPTQNIEGFTFTIEIGPYPDFTQQQKFIINSTNLQQKMITIQQTKKIIELSRLNQVEQAQQLELYLKSQGFKKTKVTVYRNGQTTNYSLKDMLKK